jgi:perosamine synthetase
MWVRKRIDIGWPDIALGVLGCCRPYDEAAVQRKVESHWTTAGGALACLSVRSGFDLLLAALDLPAKSEVLITALTIPDMVRIIKDHDLVPVPLDLDLDTMGPQLDVLRRAITPATKAIVVAHLFGGRVPMEPILALARQHGLLVIEDCAQAYTGSEFRGNAEADVSMFSFGPIKTATALGGAVIRVRDERLLQRMRAMHAAYPLQSRWFCMRRLLKYAALKALSSRPLFTVVVLSCRAMKHDYDHMLNGAVRGFPGPGFWQKIRQRPSPALLSLLSRRLRKYKFRRLAKRSANGQLLAERLCGRLPCPGASAESHTYWVFPVVAENPDEMLAALRRAGFDATQGQSMCVVPTPDQRGDMQAPLAADTLARIVFLPIYPEMPERSVRKMARAVLRVLSQRRKAKKTARAERGGPSNDGQRTPHAMHAPLVADSTTTNPSRVC